MSYEQPQRERQTDKKEKKREIQLPWLPFCSCHWLPHYLLAPLALSSIVFSFVSPSISHTIHGLSGRQDWAHRPFFFLPHQSDKTNWIIFSLSVYCYHFRFPSWTAQPLLLFRCPYLLLYDLLFYLSHKILFLRYLFLIWSTKVGLKKSIQSVLFFHNQHSPSLLF